ncbi:unnamed protein product [Soboliphyme baturini]|uniref:Tumor necrosis factor alpha-induced protein 8-like protein n=1 Tax=Soboliphyme baturini TaxID=241478 RepID=A0A183ITY3_9BILA|nr:unnamed protein product [Soboliphyme baturini]
MLKASSWSVGYVNADGPFSSKSLSVKAQKKILSKIANRTVAHHFISDQSARLLDNLYKLLKEFYTKKEAEKVVKNIIKMAIKIAVLGHNDQFSPADLSIFSKFQEKLHSIMLSVVSFHQVDFSYDKLYLRKLIGETENLLTNLIASHLTEKSVQRVHMVFQYLGATEFLDFLFTHGGGGKQISNSMKKLIFDDIGELLTRGEL